MAWFEDLSPCDYLGLEFAPFLRAVGWLERGKPFPLGLVSIEVFNKLAELMKDPWQPMVAAGNHACDLCQYEAEVKGRKNLFLPGNGILYVSPELVLHYMNAHGYAPPAEFCQAVLACPPMKSMDYLRRILDNGGRALVKRAN